MKPAFLMKITISLFLLMAVAACKEKGKALPVPSGSSNEILIVMDKAEWQGPVGDTVKQWFTQEQIGLPQPEPVFDIINLPVAFFDKNVKAYRNVLMAKISPEIDSATIRFKDSPWSQTQKYFEIDAPSEAAFLKVFEANKQKMLDVFLKAEQDRLMANYKKKPDSEIYRLFKDKYHLYLSCPSGYLINKDTTDFVWISRETRVDSRGIIFFQKEYKDAAQFGERAIVDTVNAALEKFIPGPLPKTYMALDTVAPIVSNVYNYAGKHYAVLLRGLWMVVNDYMGGPFVLNVILDQENNRVLYMMGYIYAPDDKKRNMLRQVEAILFTAGLDYKEGNR